MRKMIMSVMAGALLTVGASAAEWDIDTAHTNAYFTVEHMMIAEVHGMFPEVHGVVTLDETDITKSKVEVSIDVDSLNTGVDARDKHLRTPDFFDLANHPEMTFVSKNVVVAKEGNMAVVGDLTIRGNTNEVMLFVDSFSDAITDPWGNTRRGAKAYATINRQDFGVSWQGQLPNGALLVGDEIKITIDLEMVKAK